LLRRLQERLSGAPGVRDVRGSGLFLGVELVERDGTTPASGGAVRVASLALEEGLMLLPAGEHGHVVELTPAMVLSDEQMDLAVEVMVSAVERAS